MAGDGTRRQRVRIAAGRDPDTTVVELAAKQAQLPPQPKSASRLRGRCETGN